MSLAIPKFSKSSLDSEARRQVPISVIRDGKNSVVVSRVGDLIWDLRPLFEQSNITEYKKTLEWPLDVSADLVSDAQWVVYQWMSVGRPGVQPAGASTVSNMVVNSVRPFLRWLKKFPIERFDQLKPLHITQYVQHCKDRKIDPGGVYSALKIVELLWVFREEMESPLQFYPWGKLNVSAVSGLMKMGKGRPRDAKTLVIPVADETKLLDYCERVLAAAPDVFMRRDTGTIDIRDSALIAIRDACIYLIAISSGMRAEEIGGLETGACTSEVRNGICFNWLHSIEHKTGKGRVVYLVPDMTIGVMKVLEEYARPLQQRLKAAITQQLSDSSRKRRTADELLAIRRMEVDSRRLLLTCRGPTIGVYSLAHAGVNIGLRRVAEAAGTSWRLLSHQARRTYARMFAESQLGRRSLLFLKWQFKHSSMEMTELYAANPNQDASLFDEILEEIVDVKSELLDTWMGDSQLSGGAGRKIVEVRAIPVESRAELIQTTAQQVHIRATGHAWCLSQQRGCGGAGLYESGRCVDCNSGVIDFSFSEVWTGIYEQQLELLQVPDVGPGARDRAKRDLDKARLVLEELGVPVSER